jgi:hypothetical protein
VQPQSHISEAQEERLLKKGRSAALTATVQCVQAQQLYSPAADMVLTTAATVPLQGERLSGKCLFFVRVNPKGITEKTLETDVAVGEIQGSVLDTFKALLADLFLPLLQEQSSWGKMPPQHIKDFLTGAQAVGSCGIVSAQQQSGCCC